MRYYLAAVIGDGTDTNAYRPKLDDYQCKWTAVYSHPDQLNAIVAVKTTEEEAERIALDHEILYLGDENEAMESADFQRICPNGTVMVYD